MIDVTISTGDTVVILDDGVIEVDLMGMAEAAALIETMAAQLALADAAADRADADAAAIAGARRLLPQAFDLSAIAWAPMDPDGRLPLAVREDGHLLDAGGRDLSAAGDTLSGLLTLRPRAFANIASYTPVASCLIDPDGHMAQVVRSVPSTTIDAERERLGDRAGTISFFPLMVSNLEAGAARTVATVFVRIPCLAWDGGSILQAFGEARYTSSGADGTPTRIIWTTRAGGAWTANQVLVDAAQRSIGNPCTVYDPVDDNWKFLFRDYPSTVGGVAVGEADLRPPNVDPTRCMRIRAASLSSAGWSSSGSALALPFAPGACTEVTAGRDMDSWMNFFPGPGKGIAMHDAPRTLVAPGWMRFYAGGVAGAYHAIALRYDRAAGRWVAGAPVPIPTGIVDPNECSLIPTMDGRLLMISRVASGSGGGLLFALSSDFGASWDRVWHRTDIPNPRCYASADAVSGFDGRAHRRMFVGPLDGDVRQNGGVITSYDDLQGLAATRLFHASLVETRTADFEGVAVPAVEISNSFGYASGSRTGPGTSGCLAEMAVVRKDGTISPVIIGSGAQAFKVLTFVEWNDAWALGY